MEGCYFVRTKTGFNDGNVPDAWKAPPGRKAPKRKKAGRKTRDRGRSKTESRLEQPIADSTANVLCDLCGHPVDPRRMHAHKVRFHGAAMRPLVG